MSGDILTFFKVKIRRGLSTSSILRPIQFIIGGNLISGIWGCVNRSKRLAAYLFAPVLMMVRTSNHIKKI